MNNNLPVIKENIKNSPISFFTQSFNFKIIRDYKDTIILKQLITAFILELEIHYSPNNVPDAYMIEDINKSILDLGKNLSIEDLFFASKLARYGVIENVTSYGVIDTKFVSLLINKYKDYKSKIKRDNNISKPVEHLPSISKKEALELQENAYQRVLLEHKESPNLETLNGNAWLYDYLVEDLKEFLPSLEDKRAAMKKARKIYAAEQKKLMTKRGLPFIGIKNTVEKIKCGAERTPVNVAKKILLNEFLKTKHK